MCEVKVTYPGDDPQSDQAYRDSWDSEPPIWVETGTQFSIGIFTDQEPPQIEVFYHDNSMQEFLHLTPNQCRIIGEMFLQAADVYEKL